MKKKHNRKIPVCAHGVKRALCLLLCLLIVLPGLAAGNRAQAATNRTVRAGVFNFDGYHMQNEDGSLTGYGVEFLNLVSQYSHLNFSFVGYEHSWEDMLVMLENGEIDVVTSARKTPEREEQFAFSLPIGRNSTLLTIRANDASRLAGDYSTYNGLTIGLVSGSSQNQSLVEFAGEHGFTYTAVEYEDAALMERDLQSGAIDAILSSNLRKAENEKTLDVIQTAYFYAITRKDDTELINEINYAIDQMNLNEGDWTNVLYYKYYGNGAPVEFGFTQRELAYIEDVAAGRKQITVTAMGDRYPYSYVQDGELKGILPDYFASLMELAGLSYETVAPEDGAEYYALAENDGVDVVIDWRLEEQQEHNLDHSGFYTEPYLNTGVAFVTRKDHSGEVRTVAVADLLGDIALERDLIGDDAEILHCETRESALRAVLEGKADATYVYTYTAQSFVNNDASASLQYSLIDPMRFNFRLYVRNSCDHELITILNKCIEQMPNDVVTRLITSYTANRPGNISLREYMRANPQVLVMCVLLAAAVIGAMLALYLRSRWSKKLLNTTERANRKLEEQLEIVSTLSRDYINIYRVKIKTGVIRPVKIAGYAAGGLTQDSSQEVLFPDMIADYVNYRVIPEDREAMLATLTLENVKEKLNAGSEYAGSYRALVDGEVHTYQFVCAKRSTGRGNWEQDGFFLLGFRNIDEIVRQEQEQKAALETALVEAQRANVAKTTFLNSMSHDIRTPMNAVLGFATLAASHIENRQQVEGYLGKILTSGKHLLSLINDILDMSRIESGKVKIEENEASLPEILHDLKTIVQADVKSKQLTFQMDTLDVRNETIICDRLRLNQVLLNVLSNAMKYTGPGGTVSVRIIQTDDAPEGYASYQFRIKDTGIGMSAEFLEHLFEPFERERTATVSGIQGTGLGLAITEKIVKMMNGSISVTSEEGKGSEFVISFCFKVQEEPDDSQQLEKLAGLRALVVDDDTNTCTGASKMLSTMGLRPDWTMRGEEAVVRAEFAIEQGDPFQVILIDWLLPDLNGIEAVRRLRRVVGEKAIILLLTAYDWTDIESEAREAGVTAFCSKPLFFSGLRSVLTESCKDPEEEAEDPFTPYLTGKKILLVEDNELNQEIARTLLEEAGLIISTADNGAEAVEAIQTAEAGAYDLVLMDIQMPVMDGYTATRTIRALEEEAKAQIPIVAMTANAFEEDRQRAIDAGMDGYVPKPIDMPRLMETMKIVLEGGKQVGILPET